MTDVSDSDSLKNLWMHMHFFPMNWERFAMRFWPISVALIFAPVLFFPQLGGEHFADGLSITKEVFSNGFILSLFIACCAGGASLAYWQSTLRQTFGEALELGLVREDEASISMYFALSKQLSALMRSRWRYVPWVGFLIVAGMANQGPISKIWTCLRHAQIRDDYCYTNLAVLSVIFFLSYTGGIVCWILIAAAIWIARFSRSSCLQLQLGHPDNCCGLSDVGLCCLQSALTLIIGMLLLSLWGYGDHLRWFLRMADLGFINVIRRYVLFLLFVLFALVCTLVFLPVMELHKKMQLVKRKMEREYSEMIRQQCELSKQLLLVENESKTKFLGDRLKLVQSFDPIALKLSSWPFDRAALVTYGLTPIFTVVAPLVSGYWNHVHTSEANRPVLAEAAADSALFLPERGWVIENVRLSNVGKTAALNVGEDFMTAQTLTQGQNCFLVYDQNNTGTVLPGGSETLFYVITVLPDCLDEFKASQPLPTITITSQLSYTDSDGTKDVQTFHTAVVNTQRSITKTSPLQ